MYDDKVINWVIAPREIPQRNFLSIQPQDLIQGMPLYSPANSSPNGSGITRFLS